jgi:hypothetical protein
MFMFGKGDSQTMPVGPPANVAGAATSSTTVIQLHSEPVHPALVFLLEEWKKFQEWATMTVVQPGMSKLTVLIDQAKVKLEPKYLELKAKWDPFYAEKVAPFYAERVAPFYAERVAPLVAKAKPTFDELVEKSKLIIEEGKIKSIEYYKKAEPALLDLAEKSKPYVDAAAERCCTLADVAKRHSMVWIKDRQVDTQKWATVQQAALAKWTGLQGKLAQQMLDGAVAGALSVRKNADELMALREKEAEAQVMKAQHLKNENYVAAGIALDAQNKLKDLGDRAEAAILAKGDALNREEYATAAVHRKALDDIRMESETALSSIPPLTGALAKVDDSGLAASIASSVVANALDLDASRSPGGATASPA